MNIRRAVAADAAALSRLADELYRDTFGPYSDPSDIEAYCAAHFTTAIQQREIEESTSIVMLVERTDGSLAGYAHLVDRAPPAGIHAGNTPMKLWRFFITPDLHGTGLAQPLMGHCIEEARVLGADALWLSVWKENHRARAFYLKTGWKMVGEMEYQLGSELQYDDVMALPIASGAR